MLDRLSLRVTRAVPGQASGERRSPRSGASSEFADFRNYVAGDDLRHVDWNAYARLDRLLLRLYVGEDDLTVTLWIDVSASMDWGRPSKSAAARSLAGALAYAALGSYDRVAVNGFADTVVARLPPLRGRRSCPKVWAALSRLPSGGLTDFAAVAGAAGAGAGRGARRGLSVILSDFLSTSDLAGALSALRRSGQEVALVQVLARQEVEPDHSGEIRLHDVETGEEVEVTMTAGVLAAYRAALEEHTGALRALAHDRGAAFARVISDVPVEGMLLGDLRRAGVVA